MDKDAILSAIAAAIQEVTEASADFNEDSDLVADEILDSLDSMVFLLNLEERTGVAFPEDDDLEKRGFFKVANLIAHIQANG